MFTGIVEETGRVHSVRPAAAAIELWVQARVCGQGLKAGDSVAVNGCCLTVETAKARGKDKLLKFALLKETWTRTNLQFVQPGAGVNLERALRAGDRLGGHFVTGHIDGLGKITRWEQAGKDYVLEVTASAELMRYMVFKGSVAVDGISLTVAAVRRKNFQIWIIPHTRDVTALRERQVGEAVNLEADMLGKFVERFVNDRIGSRACSNGNQSPRRAKR
jgi:riboflavin synthase